MNAGQRSRARALASTEFPRVPGLLNGGRRLAAAAIDDTPERRLERQQPARTLQALDADAAYARSAAAARRTQGVRRLRAADRHCQSNGPWDWCRPTFADRAVIGAQTSPTPDCARPSTSGARWVFAPFAATPLHSATAA